MKDYKVGEVRLSYRSKSKDRFKIERPEDAYRLIVPTYGKGRIDHREYFKVIYLNIANQVLGYTQISEGGLTETTVDIRLIFQGALLTNAVAMILVHNHPSGNLSPSHQDRILTERVVNAGRIMNIRVLDHLIVSGNGYLSFSDQGIM